MLITKIADKFSSISWVCYCFKRLKETTDKKSVSLPVIHHYCYYFYYEVLGKLKLEFVVLSNIKSSHGRRLWKQI